jgi:hypothetical protein
MNLFTAGIKSGGRRYRRESYIASAVTVPLIQQADPTSTAASPCSRFYQRCNPFLQRYETTGRSTSELFDRKDISLFPQAVGKLRAKLNVDGAAIGKERGKSGMHLTFKAMIPLPTKITFIRICGRPADEVSHSQSS